MSDMTDKELDKQLTALNAEKAKRVEAARVVQQAKDAVQNRRYRDALAANDCGLVDALAPTHTKSRYRNHCNDTNMIGATRRIEEPKEYGCVRCDLLTVAHLSNYELEVTMVVMYIDVRGHIV